MALNNTVLMGRLVADPELKVTASGAEVCNFTIAVDRRFSRQNEEKQTDFIDCSAWRHSAVFIEKYFRKGSMIAVQGSIQTDTYTDKDGNKRKSVKVVAENVSFCGSKNENGAANASSSAPPVSSFESDGNYQEIPDDDLPF